MSLGFLLGWLETSKETVAPFWSERILAGAQ